MKQAKNNIDAPKEIIKRGIMASSWMENGEICAEEEKKPFEIFYWKKLAILSAKLSDVKYGEEFLQLIKKKKKVSIRFKKVNKFSIRF